ncbi:response regulator [Paenibacillus sp. HB172176]|uniref:response regulator n=1 Tax=Paenibacillus sp. HB172176 TaxID=2493690 RepID=UPI00143959ED|nr:response regulator [Paenibacillus sp. HB172176]
MIHVIAVDDEGPALKRIGKLLESIDDARLIAQFDRPTQCLDYVLTCPLSIDLALLDMEMPGMHGLELAKKLREHRPELHIAFLTAYEDYAREAFDVEALDYLLKPVAEEDLARTFKRLEQRSGLIRGRMADKAVAYGAELLCEVSSFGTFTILSKNGAEVRFRNSKSRELLAFLHYYRGKPVTKSHILDSLWSGKDMDRAQVNLYSTVYQLRKDLETAGLQGIVEQRKTGGGSYILQWPSPIKDDVEQFEQLIAHYKHSNAAASLIKAIQLYGEGFLAGSGYDWAAPRQAELELHFIQLLQSQFNIYIAQHRYDLALHPMRSLVRLLPLDERQHVRMTALFLLTDRRRDARDYFDMISNYLDISENSALNDFDALLENPTAFL